jgi:SAM-dependent MidA family methyltransferase
MNQDQNFRRPSEALLEVLEERLRGRARMTFAEYMELVLYHPQLGYYRQPRSPIGTDGDYFTSVSATRLFGRLVAAAIRGWQHELGEPFEVYEFGAHHGQLGRDLRAELPAVEVHSLDVGDPLPARLRGCVLSNELLDAMPFHRVKVEGGEWREQYVALASTAEGAEPRLVWELGPLSSTELERHLEPLPRHVMEGYETEVSLAALAWTRSIAERLDSGFVLSIDYGHDTLDYYAPRRAKGGLRCYRKHQLSTDPFQFVGEQDITCDVDFGAVMAVGEQSGLEVVEFTDQSRFLLRVGAKVITEVVTRDAGQFSRDRNAVHMLTHPQFLGGPFKALVQRKMQR